MALGPHGALFAQFDADKDRSPPDNEAFEYLRSDGSQNLRTADIMLEISRGNVDGMSSIQKFGRNPDCDPAASATQVVLGRDIWDGGIAGASNWLPPTAARTHQIVSSNDEDGGAGTDTGALTMRIYGLGSDQTLQSETITLNGTTNVATANPYTMIHRMECLTWGSAYRNLGNITATADTDSTVTAQITADNNQTLMAIYQVPAATTGWITNWSAEIHRAGGGAKFADVFLMSARTAGGWRVRDVGAVASDGRGSFDRDYPTYKKLDALEYVKIVADPSAVAQDIGAGFGIILTEN